MTFRFNVFAILLIGILAVSGQSITGRVIDKDSREPVPFANVFFASTLVGTTTDQNGDFRLVGFKKGKYDLVVSYVGYVSHYSTVDLSESNDIQVEIELELERIELSEVLVKPDTAGWKRNFQVFRRHFIGTTRNALKTEILNPEILVLYFDPDEAKLYAHAKEPLEIENQALGYGISYQLVEFSYEFKSGRLLSFGIPRFYELEKVKGRHLANREKAYNGSQTHLISSIVSRNFDEQGFEIRELFKVSNPDRPPQGEIDKNLKRLRAAVRKRVGGKEGQKVRINVNDLGSNISDSLMYWSRMKNLPEVIDSLAQSDLTPKDILISEGNKIEYVGHLRVKYTKEREPLAYAHHVGRDITAKDQTSLLSVFDPIRVYSNGYYEDIRSTFVQGYWSWSSGIAEMLPLDYVKNNEK